MSELIIEIQNKLYLLFEKGFKIKKEIGDTKYDKQTVILESPDCEIIIDQVRGNFDVIIKSLMPTSVLIYPLNIYEVYLTKNDTSSPAEVKGYYASYKDLEEVSIRLIKEIDGIVELFKNKNQEEIGKSLRRIASGV